MKLIVSSHALFASTLLLACSEGLVPKVKQSPAQGLKSDQEATAMDPAASEGASPPINISGSFLFCHALQADGKLPRFDLDCKVYRKDLTSAQASGEWSAEILERQVGESIKTLDAQNGRFQIETSGSDMFSFALARTSFVFLGEVDGIQTRIEAQGSDFSAREEAGTAPSASLTGSEAPLSRPSAAAAVPSCPASWLLVGGDSTYGTDSFCLMKFEAKNANGSVSSQAASSPWSFVDQSQAMNACKALGSGYGLIKNAEWMSAAAAMAARDANWTGGAVGSGQIFVGNTSAILPNLPCAASADDSLAYADAGCIPRSQSLTNPEARRTLSLPSGEVVWDMSGNMSEWVDGGNRDDKPSASLLSIEYPAMVGTSTMSLRDFVPTRALKSFWSDRWNSNEGIGKYYAGRNGSGGALLRGESFGSGATGGLFAASLGSETSLSSYTTSFRCVKR